MKTPSGDGEPTMGEGASRLVFHWPGKERGSWVMAGLMFVSVAAHVTMFFLVQPAPPTEVSLPAPAPALVVVVPESEVGEALWPWLRAQDPGFRLRFANPEARLEVASYTPSFQEPRTTLRLVPGDGPAQGTPWGALFPSASMEAVPQRPEPVQHPEPVRNPETVVWLDPVLTKRCPGGRLTIPARPSAPVPSLRILAGIGGDGSVLHLFVQESSGDDSFDAAVLRDLKVVRLEPGDAAPTFGFFRVTPGEPVQSP